MTSATSEPSIRTRVVLVVLAVGTGASDAFAFSLLGGIFTANMTGNLVLVGLTSRTGWWPSTFTGAVTATACFVAAAFLAFRFRRRAATSDTATDSLLVTVAVAQSVLAIAWLAAWRTDLLAVHLLFLAVSSASLGVQTVVARSIAPTSGITTTFMTGTLVTAVQSLAEGRRDGVATSLTAVGALVVGAAGGGLLASVAPALTPTLPAIAVIVAAAICLSSRR